MLLSLSLIAPTLRPKLSTSLFLPLRESLTFMPQSF
jgi:hypothetical protein